MFLMVLGGFLGVGGLAMDHIYYHAHPQLMGIDPDRVHEESIFSDFDHLPSWLPTPFPPTPSLLRWSIRTAKNNVLGLWDR